MDHKSFLSSLSPVQMAALQARDTRMGLKHLAGHLGLLGLGAVWIVLGWPLWWAVLLPYGVTLCFLFTLEHECTHKTPFAAPGLNEWVGRLCGVLLLLPFEWFRYFHLAHHKHTNIAGQDPELEAGQPETRAAWAWHITGLPYWSAMARQLWDTATGAPMAGYVPPRATSRLRAEARWMLVCYAVAGLSLFVSPLLVWIWILPALLGQPFLRLYLLAEHGDLPQVADMLANTRTTYTGRLVRFLAWNMPYHAEHHTAPNVPFHALPRLHLLMRTHLKATAQGYASFTQAYLARR